MNKVIEKITNIVGNVEVTISTTINYIISLAFQPIYYLLDLINVIGNIWRGEKKEEPKHIGFNHN